MKGTRSTRKPLPPGLTPIGRYLVNVLIGLDQLVGVIFWNSDPDETISSRLGKTKRRFGGRIPWRHPLQKVIDAGLEMIDPGHSIDSIEDDEGSQH